MDAKETFCYFNRCEYHKGFYNEGDISKALCNINYTDFWELPDDDEFPYTSAHQLLYGSCNHFAISLQQLFGYTPYVIQGNNKRGFHVFCQVYKNRKWYYVDARGITSSFDEFMDMAKMFVNDEYTIRPVSIDDIEEWERDSKYNSEAYAFSKAVIDKYRGCYTFEK